VGRDASLLDRARREVAVAEWLADAGVPAVRAAEHGARLVDGHPVTVWRRLPDAVRPAEPRDLAPLLRRVHELPAPPFPLPARDLLGGVERWLRLAGDAIDPADAAYLRKRRDGFADAAAALVPRLRPGPIHGDALTRNVHVGPDGPVLVDLETFSVDLREHDLVVLALSRDRYGLDPAAYDAFTDAYGWDVREWEGCAVLRGARETASCAWVAQHGQPEGAGRGPPPGRVAAGRRPGGALVPVLTGCHHDPVMSRGSPPDERRPGCASSWTRWPWRSRTAGAPAPPCCWCTASRTPMTAGACRCPR
jgi:hypothetical protein